MKVTRCPYYSVDFHRIDDFAEGGGPGVEMVNAALAEPVRIEVALDGIHLHHGVADRRAGGEGDAVAGVLLVEITGFHIEIKGPLTAAGLNTGYAFHLGRRFEVLEVMRLINVDVVDTKFVKD